MTGLFRTALNRWRIRGTQWAVAALLCGAPLAARAAALPVEGNPLLRSLLASFLATETLSDADKVARFDEFLNSVAQVNGGYQVHSLQEYIVLRNRPYGSVGEARAAYRAHGLVTPLNVVIPPSVSAAELMEKILSYEAHELTSFLAFVKQQSPASPELEALQSPLLETLPDLFLQGQAFKRSLDENSAAFVKKSFADAEAAKLRGSPSGIFSFMVGVGMSGLRGLGENVVNPLVQQLTFTETLKNQVRQKLRSQLAPLHAWPAAKKIAVVELFQRSVQGIMDKALAEVTHGKEIDLLAARLPLVDVVRGEFIPAYFANLTPAQKGNLVWQVFSTPGFSNKSQTAQMQILLSSLGPVLPHLLQQLSFSPALQSAADGGAAPSRGDGAERAAAVENLKEKLKADFAANFSHGGWTLDAVHPVPLAISVLKETYAATLRNADGKEKSVVIQVLRSGVSETLAQDLTTLQRLKDDIPLMQKLKAAGAPEVPALIESLGMLEREEIDLLLTRAKQERAREIYAKKQSFVFEGKKFALEIVPAATVGSAPTMLVQDFAGGLKLAEVPPADRRVVKAALDEFSRITLSETLTGSGFIWGEAAAKNIRVEISPGGDKLTLRLLNFGSANFVERNTMKALLAAVGKLPLAELAKTASNLPGVYADPQKALQLVQQSIDAGLTVTPQTLRLAQQLINLRELTGPEVFKQQLLGIAAKNPGLLWAPLGASWKSRLESLYAPLKHWFQKSKAEAPSEKRVLRCDDYF